MNGDTDEMSLIYESTIVPKSPLPVMRVSTIKRADFVSPNAELDEFLSETFRVPKTAVVSFEKWLRVARKLESEGIWDELEHDWIAWQWRPMPDRQLSAWRKETRRIRSEINHLSDAPNFAKICVKSILARPVFGSVIARRPLRGPIVHPLPLSNDPVLATLHSFAYLQRDRIEVTPDELAYWLNVASYLTTPAPRKVEESLSTFLDCDIPYSLSPRSQSGLLNRFVEEARLVAIFPIGSVAFPATHHLVEGNWGAAFEVLLAGAGASIVLASTFSLVEWILHLPRRQK